jgi:hypothetical protein
MKYSLLLMLLMAFGGICIGQGCCSSEEPYHAINATPDYLMNADAFLKGAMNNQYYMMTVQEFLNKSKNDTNWVIVDIRQPRDYS